MTKHEFLKQLKAELAGLPGAERRRQLDYYAELLDDMVEDGMDPEMAVERLGPVSEIANAIFRDNPQARKGSGRLGLLLGVSCGAAALVCMAGLPVLDGEPGKAPGSSGGDQGQRGPDGAHRGHPAPDPAPDRAGGA